MMRISFWCSIACCLVVFFATAGAAAQPPAAGRAPAPRFLTIEDVEEIGNLVSELPEYRDNPFLRDEKAAQLHQIAQSLLGLETDVFVFVRRVTRHEVLVEMLQVGRARFALLHPSPPYFGNLGTVRYEGPWKLQNYHRFASPIGLRIGSEIPFELARRLRRGDELRIRGQVVDAPVVTQRSAFNPSFAIIVGNWEVVELLPEKLY